MHSVLSISKENILHNLKQIRKLVGSKKIIACCLKSNGYGFGMLEYAKIVKEYENIWFCIQNLEEARDLRKNGIGNRILLISAIFEDEVEELIQLQITPIISTRKILQKFQDMTKRQGLKNYAVHLFCETGMGWLGIEENQLLDILKNFEFDNLYLEGLATHLATSDSKNDDFYQSQLNTFKKIKTKALKLQNNIKYFHCANSASILRNPDDGFDIIQPGIILYGLYPSNFIAQNFALDLKLIAKLESRLTSIKKLKVGDSVGYDRTFITDKEIFIGILGIGYYNGIDRMNSNKSEFYIKNYACKILGRVGMNSLVLDLSQVPQNLRQEGQLVTIFDKTQDIETLAQNTQTINYEIIARLHNINKRIY